MNYTHHKISGVAHNVQGDVSLEYALEQMPYYTHHRHMDTLHYVFVDVS